MVEPINLHDWLKTEKRISSNKCDVDLVTSASSYSLGGITFNRSKHLDQAPLDWAGGGHLMGDPLLLKSLLIKPAWRQRRRLAQSGHHVGDAQEASSPAAPAPPTVALLSFAWSSSLGHSPLRYSVPVICLPLLCSTCLFKLQT